MYNSTNLAFKLRPVNLRLFDGNPNTNVTTDLTVEMKTYYDDRLIDLAQPLLVHDQFGQKRPIPKNGGKTIEFRKYAPLTKATTALTEGVTPDGKKLSVSKIEATVKQYGDYVTLSDVLLLTAIDNNLTQAQNLLGNQAGMTLDTITRDILVTGTNVQYAEGQVSSRADLVGGDETAENNHYMTVKCIKLAVRSLKNQNAPKINGDYVGIIHPDIAFDLTEDPEWKFPHQYVDTENIYSGEIGKIAGVRFVETTEAKKIPNAGKSTSSGSSDRDVYCTLVLGDNAYGVTEVTGGGLEFIVKQLGSSGTADPLNQRATAGWKAIKTAEILVDQYMVRIETTSTFNDHQAN
jgi:N4-gp56 family major capsid protein